MRNIERFAPRLKGRVLDFGAGTQPYKSCLTNCTEYVSLEYDTPENRQEKTADIFYDSVHIPVPDASFDGILSTQSLEHIPNPKEILQEWVRVLRNGGGINHCSLDVAGTYAPV
ncbi:MAG: class I SAM-dependent methyltransferase [Synergistaceae bacterium]|nr:class I SAM-dependent methyltransferase [Synergistaceae bacterium]